MKKSIYFLLAFVVFVIIFNINVKLHQNYFPAITLQNIEVLSYAESSTVICDGVGSVDCPKNKSKVIFVYE